MNKALSKIGAAIVTVTDLLIIDIILIMSYYQQIQPLHIL